MIFSAKHSAPHFLTKASQSIILAGRQESSGSGSDYGERLVRIETKLEYLATQADISDLKALIADKETTQTRWLIGVLLAALGALIAAVIRTLD